MKLFPLLFIGALAGGLLLPAANSKPIEAWTRIGSAPAQISPQLQQAIALAPATLAPPPARPRAQGSVRQNVGTRRCSALGKLPTCSAFSGQSTQCSSTKNTLVCSAFGPVGSFSSSSCSTGTEFRDFLFCSAKAGGICSAFGGTGKASCSTPIFGGVCTTQGAAAFCSAQTTLDHCSVIGGSPGTVRCDG